MKIIKKFIVAVLVVLSIFSLIACSGQNKDNDVTTITRAAKVKELGDNVDKVPSATEVTNMKQNTSLLSNNEKIK